MALPPLRMAAELARIEGRVKVAPPSASTLRRAPAPAEHVEGDESPAEDELYDPEISYEKYARIRNEQEAARRGGRVVLDPDHSKWRGGRGGY